MKMKTSYSSSFEGVDILPGIAARLEDRVPQCSCESRYSQHGTSHPWLLCKTLGDACRGRNRSASSELNAIDWELLCHFDSFFDVVEFVADMTIPTPRQWEDWSFLSFNALCKCWLIFSIHSVSLTTETIVYQFILFTLCFAYHWDCCIPIYSIHCLFRLLLTLVYTSITRKPSSSQAFPSERELDRSRSSSKQTIGVFFALPDV